MAILNDGRKGRHMSTKYIDLSKIPITINVVERFFSQVKLNMTNMSTLVGAEISNKNEPQLAELGKVSLLASRA